VLIGGRDVGDVPPRGRDVAMVFQSYALYPHMTVHQNLGYGLKVARVPKVDARRRVDDVARMLGLDEMLDRKPGALSGGQRQRVAMGRAIVREPQAFLMDEPLSNLDAKLRVSMRASLAQLHRRLATTTVYVTHDQTEAMTLGQRVAVMRDGRVQQLDTPQALYRTPANLFVASFIGSPAMNLIEARLGEGAVEFGGFRMPLDRQVAVAGPRGRTVILGIRPEEFSTAGSTTKRLPSIEAEVVVVEDLGADTHVVFALDAPRFAGGSGTGRQDEDQLLKDTRAHFSARVAPQTHISPGQRIRLDVDPARFHFFDPDTGNRISG